MVKNCKISNLSLFIVLLEQDVLLLFSEVLYVAAARNQMLLWSSASWSLSVIRLVGCAHLLEINEFASRAGPGGSFPSTEDGCNCSFVLLLYFGSLSHLAPIL